MKENDYDKLLARKLSPLRYRHSRGVASYAAQLALKYNIEVNKARLAGLLHDYARDLPEGELLTLAEEAGLISCEVERKLPLLLHGPVGAYLVQKDLNVNDGEILQAISRHTVGAPDMTLLDKIIYLADALEPGRVYPGVDVLRRLAEEDLDKALLKALESSISYVLARGQLLHPATVEARNCLLMKRDNS
ncbi:MAG: bis(5'-nucleosyl)-tetraphosphatase (symmetrical) YqeK [Thermanaeromonas sp.]|uniref:bis(5'-nucleosyl)-tetraphosphatase (symmetrical) YqeK n=1 Tax=Thermanaeromonas sp. TaxID=2003697 RepID=UPI00243E2A80|nr:bis(5'-nucleosyl)-tetraphosphatase (symmetrical) YqeK [Thermanaeromonas sp.]MCG0277581.1 bis(5'-nucleosyl)-tetraphosphatase (symmetrical) YqeK [Thermanaeromonas sp.]